MCIIETPYNIMGKHVIAVRMHDDKVYVAVSLDVLDDFSVSIPLYTLLVPSVGGRYFLQA